MNKQSGYTLPEVMIVVWLLAIAAGGIGWIWNIVKLCAMTFDPLTGLLVVRAIGIIVFPVGMVVGYIPN